jgi:hypothetical protein
VYPTQLCAKPIDKISKEACFIDRRTLGKFGFWVPPTFGSAHPQFTQWLYENKERDPPISEGSALSSFASKVNSSPIIFFTI